DRILPSVIPLADLNSSPTALSVRVRAKVSVCAAVLARGQSNAAIGGDLKTNRRAGPAPRPAVRRARQKSKAAGGAHPAAAFCSHTPPSWCERGHRPGALGYSNGHEMGKNIIGARCAG